MENFETILSFTEKSLNNIRGIFDKENIETKLKELEQISVKENFWKDKKLVKKTLKQKIFEDIFNSYKKSLQDLNNLKDLHSLASKEKDEATIIDCNKKIEQILSEVKKSEINCFYLVKMTIMTFILKYMLALEELKAKTGRICCEECT